MEQTQTIPGDGSGNARTEASTAPENNGHETAGKENKNGEVNLSGAVRVETYHAGSIYNAEGTYVNQNIFNPTDLVKLSEIAMDVNKHDWDYLNRSKIHSVIDRQEYGSYLNLLMEKNLLFIASDKPKNKKKLAYEISANPHLGATVARELYFAENEKKAFSFVELIEKIRQDETLKDECVFIIGDFGLYGINQLQERFLDSITQQLHTNTIDIIKEKKIFLVLLITEKSGKKIKGSEESENLCVWFMDGDRSDAEKMPDIDTLFRELNYLEKLLLFTTASFDNLSFRHFDFIIELLIATAPPNEPIAVDVYKDFDTGAKKIKKVIEGDLQDIWNTYKDYFFQHCFLEGKNEGGRYIVDFSFPELKKLVLSYFKEKQHFFWQTQCSILENERLVFNAGVHPDVANGIINLIVESMLDDPAYYNEIWFVKIIMDIQDRDGQKYELRGVDSKEQMINLFKDIGQRKELINFFYFRLGNILKKMILNKLNLKVNDFLNSLIGFGLHNHLLILVKIISVLEEFDKFFWLKQLIERGETETKNEAYRWIVYSLSIKYPEETWTAIKSWLPKEKSIPKFSPANHYACFFVIHYYVHEISCFPFAWYGKDPEDFPLFKQHKNDPGKTREQISFFIGHALQEETAFQFLGSNSQLLYIMSMELFALNWDNSAIIRDFLQLESDDPMSDFVLHYGSEYETLLADIIESLYNILVGFSGEAHEPAMELNGFLFQTLIRETKNRPDRLNRIIKHLQSKPGIYRKQWDQLKQYKKINSDEIDEDDLKHISEFMASLHKRGENLRNLFEELNKHL